MGLTSDTSRSPSPGELARPDFSTWASMFDPLSEVVLLTDMQGTLRVANQAACELIGQPSTQLLGRSFSRLASKAAWERANAAAQGQDTAEVEIALTTRRGDPLPYAFRVTGLRGPDGESLGLLFVGADLSTERQLAELRVLHAVATATSEARTQDELIEKVTQIIGESLYSDNFGILLVDEPRGTLHAHISYRGAVSGEMQQPIPVGQGVTGVVAERGRPYRVDDVRLEPDYLEVDPRMRSELAVPIRIGERVFGVINTESGQPGRYTIADERLLTTVAGQMATGMERILLFEAERAQRVFADSLRLAGVAISATLDFDAVLDQLLEQIALVVPYDSGNVMLVEGGRARVTRMRGYEAFDSEAAPAIRELVFEIGRTPNLKRMQESGKPLVVPDTHADPDWVHVKEAAHIRSWVGAPIQWHGQLMGFFSMDKKERGYYTQEHADRLSAFASQAALALQNARLFDESQRQMRELAGLYHTAVATASELEIGSLLERLYDQVAQLIQIDTFVVALFLPETDELEVIVAIEEDRPLPDVTPQMRVPLAEGGLTGWVMRHRQALLVRDMENDSLPAVPQHGRRPARSWLGVPLVSRDRLIGAISVQAFRPYVFGDADRRFLEALAGQVANSIDNARLFAATRRQAEELRVLVETSSELRAAPTVDAMLPIILRKATGAIGASAASVFLVDRDTHAVIASAFYPPVAGGATAHAVADPWTGDTLDRGEIRIVEDTSTLPPTQILAGLGPAGRPTRSQLSLPLQSQEGPIGVLHVGTDQMRAFSPSEVRLLTAIAEVAGNALHRARVLETLEQRVSERTRELAQANELLQELDRLKSDFLSNVSHELRTPITNILLYLELLTQPGKESDRPRYTEILRREADRLARLIEDLLTLSRIEQGRAQVTLQPVHVHTLLREVLAAHEARARSREIGLAEEASLTLPLLSLDREQMVQVFANLVSNAISYTPAGGSVRVRTLTAEHDGRMYVGIEVHNSGAVIPEEDLPHVFERFYRGRNGRESGSPGTGLGLAICKEIVERHQGWIDVLSEAEAGTTFTVWVPTLPRDNPDEAETAGRPRPAQGLDLPEARP